MLKTLSIARESNGLHLCALGDETIKTSCGFGGKWST